MVDAGLPEAFLIGLGDTLLPLMGQAIVPTYNLPTLGANQTLVRFFQLESIIIIIILMLYFVVIYGHEHTIMLMITF